MILGEGTVFLIILSIGIYKVRQLHIREEASREKEKNFLLAVTHELKTPIASSSLALDTMEARELNRELQLKMIRTAKESNERLEELVDKILLSSNVQSKPSLNKVSVSVDEEVQRILKSQFKSLESILDLETSYACPEHIHVNPQDLETIIGNLLQNAIKYQEEGNKITIKTMKNGHQAIITVEDSGPGIPDSEKTKVFEKFYRIGNEMTRSTKGTGLGLFLVKELVKLNQGKIQILDNQPNGAIFEISFPLSNNGN